MRAAALLLIGLFLAAPALAEGVSFSPQPTAAREGGGVKITFGVSAPADVEVAVLGAQGKVVRHLAAGVLGGTTPPPAPLRAGLSQTLEWDGRDDLGQPAGGGPFKTRVRAGTGARFGRLIGQDPYVLGGISSVATDEEGSLYPLGNTGGKNQNHDTLRAFSPEGKYLRTLVPFPADLPPEAAAASWDAASKTFRLRNQSAQLPHFYPWGSGARIVGASTKNGILLTHGTNLFRMDLAGGNLTGPTPMWSPAAKVKNPPWNVPQLAASPDGRYVFFSNVAGTKYDTKNPSQIDARWPQGRVYRQDTSKPGSDPEPFYDLELPDWEKAKYWMPNAWNKRTAAYGITLDAKGTLFVCDLVNQEVVEVSRGGKKLSATKVLWPERVHVSGESGSLYVIAREKHPRDGYVAKRLLKVTGRGEAATVVAQLPLKGYVGEASALGRIGGKPVLWLAGGGEVLCVRDAGASFDIVETAFAPKPDSQADWNRIAVDAGRDEVYASNGVNGLWRYDGRTGRGERLRKDGKPFYGVDLAIGYDGLLYVRTGQSYSGPFERFTRDLAPAPFASGSHVLSPYIYSRFGIGNCEKGLGVGPSGESYISFMYGWNKYFVAGFGPDGKPVKGTYLKGKIPQKLEGGNKTAVGLDSAVIGPITASSGGIRVDLAGNIYLGLRLLPKDFPRPAGFEKDPAYKNWTGSVVKFPPSGGTVLGAVKEDDEAGAKGPGLAVDRNLTLLGALAVYPGVGPFSGDGWGGGSGCCVCRVPRFDLDRYGRLAFPNAVTNSVMLLDNAGNRILEIGAYGNFDSQHLNPNTPQGKEGKPTVAVPEVPLGWPTGVGLNDSHIYINDTCNRRIVRSDLFWKAEAICDVSR
jgi:hypothetical protein